VSGVPPKNSDSKGTAVKKSSQIQPVGATAFPERVSVAMTEIAENMQEGLLALAVGAGLQVMAALMEADVTVLAGPKGKQNMTRTAVRHGHECGSVTLGGRRVPVTRPRVRAADGAGELPIASYELFTSTEILGRMALEKMLAGLSTRRYPVGLEPVGERVAEKASATSKSAVSRRFVAMTETALAELLSQDLSGLDLVALMIDGVHFAESCCIVALGVGIDGVKHPLALVEGSTENATLVTELLVGCGSGAWTSPARCWSGSTGPRRCAGRFSTCWITRSSNAANSTRSELTGLRVSVGGKMTDAYHTSSALEAEAALLDLANELDRTHPGAAASLREGLHETLTVLRLGVPPTLARTLHSTNCIESMISISRDHARNVQRWSDGQMALRWCAARHGRGRQAVPPRQRPPAPAHAPRPHSNIRSPEMSYPSYTLIW
jgi:putative transposase